MNINQDHNMAGKVCLITGSSRGIGYYTALELAQKGAEVIIVSHNQERAQQAADEINVQTKTGRARFYTADLSSQADIHRLVDQIKQDYTRLDVLVNNAGGWFSEYQESVDGIEMTFALNHLNYFLLTGLLLGLLQESRSGRIVNVSSMAHQLNRGINYENLQSVEHFGLMPSYAQSKAANIMFTYELANRLKGTGITVNALHPGLVNSHLYRNFGIFSPLVKVIAKLFGKNSPEGAQTSIYLASSPEVADVMGKYFVDKKIKPTSPATQDREAWQRLWQVSEAMTWFKYPV